ncbi:MAG: hypothetical protein ACKPAE_02715, partial [Microcystis panniformis]
SNQLDDIPESIAVEQIALINTPITGGRELLGIFLLRRTSRSFSPRSFTWESDELLNSKKILTAPNIPANKANICPLY